MLTLRPGQGQTPGGDTVWIDLHDPTDAERRLIEDHTGLRLPTLFDLTAPLHELSGPHRRLLRLAATVHDVLLSIYRPLRSKPAGAMRVTFSLDLLLFRVA